MAASIHALPTKILSHIFTAGCQFEPEVLLSRDSVPRPSKTLPWLINPVKGRRMKNFSLTAASVCSYWRDIVDLKSNAHLWNLLVSLHFPPDGRHDSFLSLLAVYRNEIRTSGGCDLDIYWAFESNVLVPTPVHHGLFFAELRLFLYGMRMLMPYKRQWRSISATTSNPYMTQLLYSMLSDTQSTPIFSSLTINHPKTYWEEEAGFMASVLDDYIPSIQDSYSTVLPTIPHLLSLRLIGVKLPSVYPTLWTLQSLWIQEWWSGDYGSWIDIDGLMKQLRNLTALSITIPSFQTRSTPFTSARFLKMKQLSVGGIAPNLVTFLSSFDFPSVETLHLTFQGDPTRINDLDVDLTVVTFPSLQYLHLIRATHIEATVLRILDAPALMTLNTQYYDDGYISQTEVPPADEQVEQVNASTIIQAPKSLILSGLYPATFEVVLRHFDMQNVVFLKLFSIDGSFQPLVHPLSSPPPPKQILPSVTNTFTIMVESADGPPFLDATCRTCAAYT